GHTTRSGRDARQLKLSKQVVGLGHGSLSLEHLNQHTRLVVAVCGEDLRLLARNSSVVLNQLGHHTTSGLDTERQRSDVNQQHVLLLSSEHSSLDGGTVGNGLVGVNRPAELLAVEELRQQLLILGDTGRSTNQDNVVDLG